MSIGALRLPDPWRQHQLVRSLLHVIEAQNRKRRLAQCVRRRFRARLLLEQSELYNGEPIVNVGLVRNRSVS